MMKNTVLLTVSTVLSLGLFANMAMATNQPTETYKNQRGSVLVLERKATSANSGELMGMFTTAVASKRCQDLVGKSRPIKGYYTGNALSITVDYPSCGTVVSIIGNKNSKNQINTIWVVANQAKHAQGQDWNTRYIGNDTYTLTKKS